MCVCAHSVVFDSCNTMVVARKVPPSMGFSRQEYWSRLPLPSPGHLPHPGIKPASPGSPALGGGFFTTDPPGNLSTTYTNLKKKNPIKGMCFWNEKTSSVFPTEFEKNQIFVFFICNGQSSCWSYQILFPLRVHWETRRWRQVPSSWRVNSILVGGKRSASRCGVHS